MQELHAAIAMRDPALTIFYCAPDYDRDELANAMRESFPGQVIGCTTAGEISPAGYMRGSLVGVSLAKTIARVAVGRVDDLSAFELADGERLARGLLDRLADGGPEPTGRRCFGYMLIDGLSMKEEHVVSAIYRELGDIPLMGGSAGDGERFAETHIYHDGAFRRGVCVLAIVETDLPFVVFRTQHFVPSLERMVVTEADVPNRIVSEINGEPAGREYARMVGLEVDKLTPLIFATHPVVVQVGGDYYVRSIQKVNDDESLTFFCAIDEGIVLTVARGVDLVANLLETFTAVRQRVGEPQLVLGCDCILRHLELDRREIKDQVAEIFAANRVVGFSTYGEQFHGMHVNQTFTGVALGSGVSHG